METINKIDHIWPLYLGEEKPSSPIVCNWSWYLLTDIAKLETGHTPSRYHPEYWGGNICWVSIRDIKEDQVYIYDTKEKTNELGIENSSARMLPKGTVVMTRGPTIGKTCILGKSMSINQSSVAWIPSLKLDSKFLYYTIKLSRDYLETESEGTTMNTIYMKDICNIWICMPDINTQKRIVSKLDAFFEHYNKLKEEKQKANNMREKIMQSAIASLIPRGEQLPEGWKEKELSEICEKITDGSHFTPKYVENGYPFVTIKNVKDGRINFDTCKMISRDDFIQLKRNDCNPKNGDILFSKDGTVGKVIEIDFDKDFIVLSSLAIIRVDQNKVLPAYVKYILKSGLVLKQAGILKTGTAITRVVLKNLKKLKIRYPKSIAEQKLIILTLQNVEKHIAILSQEYLRIESQLEQLPKSVLAKAFRGELD